MTLFQKRFQNVRNHFVLNSKHEKNGTLPRRFTKIQIIWESFELGSFQQLMSQFNTPLDNNTQNYKICYNINHLRSINCVNKYQILTIQYHRWNAKSIQICGDQLSI